MLAKIRQGDPKDLIVAELQFYASALPLGIATDGPQSVVNNTSHRVHYPECYQLTQLWTAGWLEINGNPYSRMFITDPLGNLLARNIQHLTSVQKP
jgi:hypothetical protein